ncbi:MAG: acyl-CoA thioesterase [Actinomycetales bacterium]
MANDDIRGNALAELLQLMDLKRLGRDEAGRDLFEGARQLTWPSARVFGGQVLGQAMMAASLTVEQDRPVHSMHGYFLRPGDSQVPISFEVERLRDGRSFSARRVLAIQHGRPIAGMSCSFQLPADGYDHAQPMPQVPEPESLPSTADLIGHVEHPLAQHYSHERPFDVRHVTEPIYLSAAPEPTSWMAVWMKAVGPMPDRPLLHRAVLAYASDYTMLEPILRRHGLSWTSGQVMASLDHSMWWHRTARVDEWLLYVLDSPSAQGGRGLGFGRIYTQDGRLVATVAQEGMIRPPRD